MAKQGHCQEQKYIKDMYGKVVNVGGKEDKLGPEKNWQLDSHI